MDRSLQRLTALSLLCGLTACVRVTPYTAEELASATRPAKMLVKYLEQRDADPGVCDMSREGPALTVADASVVSGLFKGFDKGKIVPDVAAGCALSLWKTGPTEVRQEVANGVIARLPKAAKKGDVERTRALIYVLERHPPESPLTPKQAGQLIDTLRPIANRAPIDIGAPLDGVIASLEAAAGRFEGVPVTEQTIADTSDEERLLAWARRLPQEGGLREAAGKQLVAVRVAASPYAWVRETSELAEAQVLDQGFLAVPSDLAVVGARWAPREGVADLVRVLQIPSEDSIRLVLAHDDGDDAADARLPLSDGLEVSLDGWDKPITLCPGADAWDPTPCLPADRLQLAHPIAWLDGPSLRLRDTLTLDELVALGREGEQTRPQLTVGGVVVEVPLGIHFDPVRPLVYGPGPGQQEAPDLKVQVYELTAGRIMYAVRSTSRSERVVIVPRHDVMFRIQTEGGKGKGGMPGKAGKDGAPGADGNDARCPDRPATSGGSGGPGTQGGRGGNGGKGGDGGDIKAVVHCGNCYVVERTVERVLESRGAAGGDAGSGGSGGAGGAGGSGGKGASCSVVDPLTGASRSVSLPAGRSGTPGPPGAAGARGMRGLPGAPGNIRIRIAEDEQ